MDTDNITTAFSAATQINADTVVKDSKIKFKAEDLETICVLGAGSGGTVSKVIYKPTGQIMARKIVINMSGVMDEEEQEKLRKQVMRELRILKLCRSPLVVSFYGAFVHDSDINIMMEYMDLGTLERVYYKTGAIVEIVAQQISRRIIEGLIYLYENHKIVHRDIKPSNILVNSNGEIKISDFGVSKELNGTQADGTFVGTQKYLAPERVMEGTACTPSSDVWSLGLMIMETVLGRFPLPAAALATDFDLIQFIQQEPMPLLPSSQFSQPFCDFIAACLIKDPNQRPHPQQLLATPFMQEAAFVRPDLLYQWAQSLVPLLKS